MRPEDEFGDLDEDLLFHSSRTTELNSPMFARITSKGLSMSTSATQVRSTDNRDLRTEEDIVAIRAMVKRVAVLLGFSLVNQTKVVTAASEIARNTLEYGGGGHMTIEVLESESGQGIRLSFQDQGPGIPDMSQAMKDGYTSGSGMGLGLGGSKRLMDEFTLTSDPGNGTLVVMTKWS